MVDESVVLCEVDAVQEGVVKSVKWLQGGGGRVVDGAGSGFDDWLDVGFVLVHECLG